MSTNNSDNTINLLQDILESVDQPYYLVDNKFIIRSCKLTTSNYMNIKATIGDCCHKTLYNLQKPCRGCLIHYPDKPAETNYQKLNKNGQIINQRLIKDGKETYCLNALKTSTENSGNDVALNVNMIKHLGDVFTDLINLNSNNTELQFNNFLLTSTRFFHFDFSCIYLSDKQNNLILKYGYFTDQRNHRELIERKVYEDLMQINTKEFIEVNPLLLLTNSVSNNISTFLIPLKLNYNTLGFYGIGFQINNINIFLKYKFLLKFIAQAIANTIDKVSTHHSLLEAKTKAEESDKLKSAFLSNLSHEIRTPMNSILGFSEVLEKYNLSEAKQKTYIKTIHRSAVQLLHIIEDILDISKIQSNQYVVLNDYFHLNELLDSLHKKYIKQRDEAGKQKINLECEKVLDNLNDLVYSDGEMLSKIYANLLSNAIKFTSKGHIKFGYVLEPAGWLIGYVRDTGIGIKKEAQDLIFEMFRQIEEPETREFGGTGLGLAISRALVEKLDGTIWVESVEGKGSSFFFRLPIQLAENTLADKHNGPFSAIMANNLAIYNKKTILIADDNEDIHLYFDQILEDTGIKLLKAFNGKEALELVNQHKNSIHLAMIDIQMPIMNGYEAIAHIKSAGFNFPIIVQTAYAYDNDRKKASDLGCVELITKPIKKNELFTILNKYLKKQ